MASPYSQLNSGNRMKYKFYCLLVLLFPLSIQAQEDLSTLIPFMDDSMEPEIFYLDPNYDQHNEISYYSLGDLWKVQYKYDELHRPITKSEYLIDKFDLRWNKFSNTTYTYKGSRLTNKTTSIFADGRKEIYKVIQIHSPHETLPIDTIREEVKWIDERYKTAEVMPPLDNYIIRYLNNNHNPLWF